MGAVSEYGALLALEGPLLTRDGLGKGNTGFWQKLYFPKPAAQI